MTQKTQFANKMTWRTWSWVSSRWEDIKRNVESWKGCPKKVLNKNGQRGTDLESWMKLFWDTPLKLTSGWQKLATFRRRQKWPYKFSSGALCYFRNKCVVFAHNCKFSNLIHCHEQYIICIPYTDIIFVKNFTQPDFQVKSFTPQKCIICDIFLAN